MYLQPSTRRMEKMPELRSTKTNRNLVSQEMEGSVSKKSTSRFKQALLFHRDGHYWNRLKNFPGALFDTTGYVLFQNEDQYLSCSGITVKSQTNLTGSITRLSQLAGMSLDNLSSVKERMIQIQTSLLLVRINFLIGSLRR